MAKKFWFLLMAPLLAVSWVVVGCSIDDSSDSSETMSTNVVSTASTNMTAAASTNTTTNATTATQINVTGTWTIAVGSTVIDTWILRQSGLSVQGSNRDGRSIVGSTAGDQFLATVLPAGSAPTANINATVTGNTMRGTAASTASTSNFTGMRPATATP